MRTIDYFDRSAELHPDRTAITDGELSLSYGEVQDLTRRLARAMRAAGLKHQEPVAVFSPNHSMVLIALLGLWRAGAVWIPVNSRNALDANAAYLNYVRASWLFYHSAVAEDARRMAVQVPSLKHLICLDGGEGDSRSIEQLLASGGDAPEPDWGDPLGNPQDLVGIIATGGTTGPAKGVEVTNLAWGTMVETAMNAWRAEGPLVCLATAPLTHAAGPVSMAALAMGATIAILPGFEPLKVMEAIERFRVTHMFLPPTALYLMLAHPRVREFDYSSLRIFLLAGSPASPDKVRQAVEVFGPCICQSYGQTELPMIATWLPPETVAAAAAGDHPERLASCGRASPAARLGLMDDDGRLLGAREPGEIVARGSLVTRGYFELPQATADVRIHGWHHTGDVAWRDEEGFYYIVDRKKDMIVTGGFNVFCAEVEATVMELPQVRECAVIGAPDETWGEAVTAVVALGEGQSIDPAEIIAHCKARLGGVKAPKAVHVWPEVPRTPAGKFDKKAIRAKFWGGAQRNVN